MKGDREHPMPITPKTPSRYGELFAEIDRLSHTLATVRLEYANLLAAARATLGAHRDGETDPLAYLTDELSALGQLPPRDLPVPARDAFRIAIGLTLTDHEPATQRGDDGEDGR